MVIVLKKDISESQKSSIKSLLQGKNFKINEVKGEESTILAAVGKVAMDTREVEILPGVASVIPISKPYKMASREFKSDNTIVEIPNNRGQTIRVGGSRLVTIAGPSTVESREQIMESAKAVSESGAVLLYARAFRQSTSPYAFAGLGEKGLSYLKEAGEKYALPVVTEIVTPEHIPLMCAHDVDVFLVGARNMQNFELLKQLGKLGKPVILKRGLSATIEEWLMSAEYLLSSGTDKVILCERGIRTYEQATRTTLDLSAIPILREMTHLPIIADPSHALGMRDKIEPMALAAIAAGSDGIIVDVHPAPEKALSDASQALFPEQLEKIIKDIEALAPVLKKEVAHIKPAASEKKSEVVEHNSPSKPRCLFSGMKGAYAEMAVIKYFENQAQAVQVDSFGEIFQQVVDGKAEYGMVPIENSTAGSIYNNYDNLTRYEDISIVGAITLKIEHSLLAPRGATLETIKNVYSHPQALSQSSAFLERHKWNLIDSISTATGASIVAKKNSVENAAVANARNAQIYGLEILKEGIENNPNNYTRFVIIAANHFAKKLIPNDKKPNMVTLMFSTKNEAGALYNALGVFKDTGLSMNRLESRPIAGKPWQYWFYTDASLSGAENPTEYVEQVVSKLKECAQDVRILGIYAE
ncbi:MAG: 3-deoxy-7-phosphoheptulonate synthase [Treponema sp.]|nr:3-deoxy-7-phosphoheptulonate synthase [Treponema sp.]